MTFVFAYSWLLPWLCGSSLAIALYVAFIKRSIVYRYALTRRVKQQQLGVGLPIRKMLFVLRAITIFVLALLIARPQWLDSGRNIQVKGIDIVLALDVSGSMELFDDLKDRTPRIEAAKREALDFVIRRTNDPIGIVLFAAQAFSKVPLTLDKPLLIDTIKELSLGEIDTSDTLLFTGLATAINRLRYSTATSKIIVLLTDGVPSDNDPISVDTVISIAQEFGIKIYTLGVGRADRAYTYDQFGRVAQVPSQIDSALLQKIAAATGGHSYRVYTPADLKNAYASIDTLERTEIKTTLFHNYYEAFSWFMWIVLIVFFLELFLRMIVLKGLV